MAQAISKMETTQTAVEWLALRYHHRQGYLSQEDIEQAKQMEKEQHGTTWDKALNAYEDRGHLYIRAWTDFDEYFKETYGKKMQ